MPPKVLERPKEKEKNRKNISPCCLAISVWRVQASQVLRYGNFHPCLLGFSGRTARERKTTGGKEGKGYGATKICGEKFGIGVVP